MQRRRVRGRGRRDELRRVFFAHRAMYLCALGLAAVAAVCRWGLPAWTDGRYGLASDRDVAPALLMAALHAVGPLVFHPTLSRLRY